VSVNVAVDLLWGTGSLGENKDALSTAQERVGRPPEGADGIFTDLHSRLSLASLLPVPDRPDQFVRTGTPALPNYSHHQVLALVPMAPGEANVRR
jgi:hypothetical protein